MIYTYLRMVDTGNILSIRFTFRSAYYPALLDLLQFLVAGQLFLHSCLSVLLSVCLFIQVVFINS